MYIKVHEFLIIRKFCMRRPLDEILERATGIEPALYAWEAHVLPLNYARMNY